jgi:hypothetical protein
MRYDMTEKERQEKYNRYTKALEWCLNEGFAKVAVDSDTDGVGREWLWCTPIEGKDGLLEVCNIPFFNDSVCIGDIIEVELLPEDERPRGTHFYKMRKVVEHVTEGIGIIYEADDDIEKLRPIYRKFCEECQERKLRVEGAVPGVAVVAAPWGQRDESCAKIIEAAEKSGLKLKCVDE